MVHQHRLSLRELTVLKRIVILVTIIVGLGFPTVVVIFIYVCTNYVTPFKTIC
jgi:hypothetical protein